MQKLKSLIVLLILFSATKAITQNNGMRFPSKEYTVVKFHSHYHFKEDETNNKGLNYVIEAGYTGKIYALVGFEQFSALKGGEIEGKQLDGYTSFHGAIGFNLTHGHREQFKYNAGIRIVKAYRGPLKEKRFRPFVGWEGGITYQFKNGFGIGLRGTLDHRYDQDIFDWEVTHVGSAYLALTYKIKELHKKIKKLL